MSGRAPRLWLVCYDVADDKRRTKVYQYMRGAGDWVQYSVFRCVLSELQLAELKAKLERVLAGAEDQVLFVPLGPAESPRSWRMFTLGRPMDVPPRSVRIV